MSEPFPDDMPDPIMEEAVARQATAPSTNGAGATYDPVEVLVQRFAQTERARELHQRRKFGTTENTWAPRDIAKTITGVYAGTIQPPRPSKLALPDGGPCLFYDGRINGVFGAYVGGKTWVALLTTAEELRAGGVVVYVDFEDDEVGIITRLKQLGVTQDQLRHLRYVHPDAAPTDEEYRGLLKLIEETKAALVVIDSVGEWLGLAGIEGNGDAQVAEWAQRYVKRLVRWGACALLLDHVPHEESQHRVLRAIGSQRKMAAITGSAFRAVVVEEPGRGRRGVVQLIGAKDRHGHWVRGVPAADVVIDATQELKVEVRAPRAPVSPETDELLLALYNAGADGITAEEAASVLAPLRGELADGVVTASASRAARRRLAALVGLVEHVPAKRGGRSGGASPARWVITDGGRRRVESPEEVSD